MLDLAVFIFDLKKWNVSDWNAKISNKILYKVLSKIKFSILIIISKDVEITSFISYPL